jgi:hypothetical protein
MFVSLSLFVSVSLSVNRNMDTFIIMIMDFNMNMNMNMNMSMDTDMEKLLDLKNARMPNCMASSQSGIKIKRMVPEPFRYRTKPMQSGMQSGIRLNLWMPEC